MLPAKKAQLTVDAPFLRQVSLRYRGKLASGAPPWLQLRARINALTSLNDECVFKIESLSSPKLHLVIVLVTATEGN